MIERYIENLEEERREDRRERKKAVWGIYVAILILLIQALLGYVLP